MPEGPETKQFVDSLNKFLSSTDDIMQIEVISGRYTKKPIEGIEKVKFPLSLSKVSCKGKFIYWEFLNTDIVLFNTLGMSGGWSSKPKNARVKFITNKGDLYFNDARNFGTLKFTTKTNLKNKLESLGPDMLNENVDSGTFIKSLRRKPNLTLAESLMNQHIISGVGNYLKSDSLWLAKLSPNRLVKNTNDEELTNLCKCISYVIRCAYELNGKTILTYQTFDESPGSYSNLVYGKKFDPCGDAVICEETKDGRTTWWVPTIQK